MNLHRVQRTRLRSLKAWAVLFFILSTGFARGDSEAYFDEFFHKGSFETSLGGGALFSPFAAIRNRPTLNYTLSEFQLGYMMTDVAGHGIWRGNWEVANAAFGGKVFEGIGDFMAGATIWLRYNFVPCQSRFAPFVQAGAGGTYTDINPRLVGQDFNFNLDLGAGVRYLLSPHWSVNLEYRYQHISNANMADRNLGVNAHGPMLAVSFFF
jgi:opacity protein-like surface antigen